MTATKTLTITLPSYWASYLINGDASGLMDGEKEIVDRAIEHCGDWVIVSCDGEPRFTRAYQLYDPEAECSMGEVLDYTMIKRLG